MNIKVVKGMISEASPWADEENEVKWVPPRHDYLANVFKNNQKKYGTVFPASGGEEGN